MYRFVKYAMPAGLLVLIVHRLHWIDVFHLTAAATVVSTMLLLGVLVRRWRRGGLPAVESDTAYDEAPSPGLVRGLLMGAVGALVFNGLVFGGVRVLQTTPLYSLWSDGDLATVQSQLQTLADAKSYEEAARLAEERLARPASPQARQRLAELLVNYLTQAGRVCRDKSELDRARQLLSQAVTAAETYGANPDLASVLAKEIEDAVGFRRRLETLQQSGKWAELLTAVEERMVADGQPAPWLVSLSVQSAIRLGVDPNYPLDERLGHLQHAVAVAVQYGRDPSEAQRELAHLEEQKHFAEEIDQLCRSNQLDEAAGVLRLAIKRSPRKSWIMPLDRLLYETLLKQARASADPAAQKNRYEEAVAVAQAFGLDMSVATQALRDLKDKDAFAARAAEAEERARKEREQAEDVRRRLAEMQRQNAPGEILPGAKAGFARLDTGSHPLLLVDLWVANADDSPYRGLVQKDFRATFGGLPATVVLAAVPAQRRERRLRVVLVIDSSGSMEGKALAEAKKGAAQFIDSLPAEAQIAVVRFADSVEALCEFSQDRPQIRQAIERIRASGQTALYNAIDDAAARLSRSSLPATCPDEARFIVLLSDGQDSGTGVRRVDQVLANCCRAQAQVYAIGLKSATLDAAVLKKLAGATKGAYLEAGSEDQLAQQFRIASVEVQRERYRLAVSVPAENERGTLAITIGSGPNSLSLSTDVEAGKGR